jgi:hypothetical protein
MKSIVRSTLIAGLLAGSALINRAEEPAAPATAPAAPATAPAAKKAHTAPAGEAKKLTPEERKARAEARLKALRAKKASGKLTEKEAQQLERLEKRGTEPAAKAAHSAHKAAAAKAGDTKAEPQGATK